MVRKLATRARTLSNKHWKPCSEGGGRQPVRRVLVRLVPVARVVVQMI